MDQDSDGLALLIPQEEYSWKQPDFSSCGVLCCLHMSALACRRTPEKNSLLAPGKVLQLRRAVGKCFVEGRCLDATEIAAVVPKGQPKQ